MFDSDQPAVAELLRTTVADGSTIARQMASSPTVKVRRAAASSKTASTQQQLRRGTQIGRSNVKTGLTNPPARTISISQNGGLTRLDMLAGVLGRHPRRTVRELIALLEKEFRWKTTESAVTGHLYTHRDRVLHIPPGHSSNRPATWSLK